jgi:glycyl-tRNA synthetase beta chain
LYEYYISAEETVSSMYKMRNYDGIFGEVVKGREVINTFFDKVMVMDKDEKVKTNRLSLLKALNNIFNKVAVMSMINE